MVCTTPFNPTADMPDLTGKTILVTGGSSGLGLESIKHFALHGATVIMAARNRSKARGAITSLEPQLPTTSTPITILDIDLADLSSIQRAAHTFLSTHTRLDILMLNGGVMALPPALTTDGYEIQLGTNHLGHALLTKLLLPLLLATASLPDTSVRIITLTSSGAELFPAKNGLLLHEHARTPMSDLSPWARYGRSKAANILFTKALAQKYPSITSVAVHPGLAKTALADTVLDTAPWWQRAAMGAGVLFMPSVETAVRNQLWASVAAAGEVESGKVYYPVAKEHAGIELVNDPKEVERLWEWTEGELARFE